VELHRDAASLGSYFFLRHGRGPTASCLTRKNPIPLTKVEGRMDHLGGDVKGRRIFATAFDDHSLEVIDLKTGRRSTSVNDPHAVSYRVPAR